MFGGGRTGSYWDLHKSKFKEMLGQPWYRFYVGGWGLAPLTRPGELGTLKPHEVGWEVNVFDGGEHIQSGTKVKMWNALAAFGEFARCTS